MPHKLKMVKWNMKNDLKLKDTEKLLDILEFKIEDLGNGDGPEKFATIVIEEWYKE